MKFGRFQLQSRTFFGLVEGDQVTELDGSPFDLSLIHISEPTRPY